MKSLNKRIQYIIIGLLLIAVAIPATAMVGSKVVSVTATIENALSISSMPIDFGKITQGNTAQSTFNVSVSDAFFNEENVKGLQYTVGFEHKPVNETMDDVAYCADKNNFPDTAGWQSWGSTQWDTFLNDEYFDNCALPMCPFIERIANDSSEPGINDTPVIPNSVQTTRGFFDALAQRGVETGAIEPRPPVTEDIGVFGPSFPRIENGNWAYQPAYGTLDKQSGNTSDDWTLKLNAPCFNVSGQGCNATVEQQVFGLPAILRGNSWACNLRVEVTSIER